MIKINLSIQITCVSQTYKSSMKINKKSLHSIKQENISCANQPLRANNENLNLGHQINIQGEGRRGWEGDLQKCD